LQGHLLTGMLVVSKKRLPAGSRTDVQHVVRNP